MNIFNKLRNIAVFPELADFTKAVEAEKNADRVYYENISAGFGPQMQKANTTILDDYTEKLEEIRELNKGLVSGQHEHMTKAAPAYKDVLKIGPYHDKIAEKAKALENASKQKEKAIENREKIQAKYKATNKDSKEYKSVSREYINAVKDEKEAMSKFEKETAQYKQDSTTYQEDLAVALASSFTTDLESRLNLSAATIEAGIKIQKVAESIEYVEKGNDQDLDEEILTLTQMIEQGA